MSGVEETPSTAVENALHDLVRVIAVGDRVEACCSELQPPEDRAWLDTLGSVAGDLFNAHWQQLLTIPPETLADVTVLISAGSALADGLVDQIVNQDDRHLSKRAAQRLVVHQVMLENVSHFLATQFPAAAAALPPILDDRKCNATRAKKRSAWKESAA